MFELQSTQQNRYSLWFLMWNKHSMSFYPPCSKCGMFCCSAPETCKIGVHTQSKVLDTTCIASENSKDGINLHTKWVIVDLTCTRFNCIRYNSFSLHYQMFGQVLRIKIGSRYQNQSGAVRSMFLIFSEIYRLINISSTHVM